MQSHFGMIDKGHQDRGQFLQIRQLVNVAALFINADLDDGGLAGTGLEGEGPLHIEGHRHYLVRLLLHPLPEWKFTLA